MIGPERKRKGRPRKECKPFIQIAAAVDFRGENDDRLFFLFRDPPAALLEAAFTHLLCGGRGIARAAVITDEHDIVKRVGYGYWRKAVEMIDPNYNFSELETMKVLIRAVMQRVYPCNVKWMPIGTFLNI